MGCFTGFVACFSDGDQIASYSVTLGVSDLGDGGWKVRKSRSWFGLITILTFAWLAPRADAAPTTFSNTANGLSASATFTISGDTLTILLTNTDTAVGGGAAQNSANVLSGLFFNLGATLAPVSALLPGGSSIIQTGNCDVNNCVGKTDVGGEWSYASGGASWLAGTNQGISSSGYLNNNTSSGNFGTAATNYQHPDALNGIEFGIVPDGWVAGSGNPGLDSNALIEGSVQFVLTGVAGLTEQDIKNVYFTYGTSAREGTLVGTTSGVQSSNGSSVPEPALLSLIGLGAVAVARRLKRAV